MTPEDIFMTRLTAWRENRGGGYEGMQTIVNVIVNRAAHRGTSPYAECIRPWQFSSITATGDSQLTLYPSIADAQWKLAESIVQDAADGKLPDITDGAVLYYNPAAIVTDQTITLPTGETIPWPKTWNRDAVTYIKEISNHRFFK